MGCASQWDGFIVNPILRHHFDNYLALWGLIVDGEPIITNTSKLLPVEYNGTPAMLKIVDVSEERQGGQLMIWWDGDGAARVLEHDDDAYLMERAVGKLSLIHMAKNNQDTEASRIISAVVAKLHHVANKSLPPSLVPLSVWFKSLYSAAQQGGILKQAADIAFELLKAPQENSVLHGDIHHGNILDFGERGWLAIDPKGLLGERGFDYANIFCNPELMIATKPERLEEQATIVAQAAGLSRDRLIKWIFAYAGLSAAWHLEDGSSPDIAIAVTHIAGSMLKP